MLFESTAQAQHRLADRRYTRCHRCACFHCRYDNTYITSPEGYGPGTKFERHKVQHVLESELKSRLEGKEYDPVKSSQISKMLADELREKVCCSAAPTLMAWSIQMRKLWSWQDDAECEHIDAVVQARQQAVVCTTACAHDAAQLP